MELRRHCWRCSGLGLVIVAQKNGYTVYRQCPECRKESQ